MSETTNIATIQPNWVEKNGGFFLSLFFHILVFSFLITRIPEKPPKPVEARRISLMLIAPAPMPPQPPLPSQILPTEARATHMKPEKKVEPDLNKPSTSFAPKQPDRSRSPEIPENMLSEIQTEITRQQKELEYSLSDLHWAIEKRTVYLKGAEANFNSAGAEKGTVRILDVKNVSEKISEQVLRKYQIRITQKYIDGSGEVQFLNQASVREKTFVSQKKSGYFEVFEIPPTAMRKLTLLEQEEIQKRGLDSGNTRVTRIVFGIVKQGEDFDIGVTEFEYEELK